MRQQTSSHRAMTGLRGVGVALLIGISLTGFRSAESIFAPSSDLWERWQAHAAGDTRIIDQSRWDAFLKKYVRPAPNGVHVIDYGGVAAEDRKSLDTYIAEKAALPISQYNRREQFAYWVNLYNALTVKVVLDHYPVASIRDIDISPGFFSDGPWGKKLIQVEGEELTLNDIEHRILRPIWNDPRIHYAVNCASIGCPNLLTEAFTAGNTEKLLEIGARAYINDPRGVSVDGANVTVSKIYDWFHEDFGGTEQGVLDHLLRYAAPPLAVKLRKIGGIAGTAYDWTLNSPKSGS